MSTQTVIPSAQILIVPGLYGSGPDHWQSQWEKQHPEFSRVEQDDWNTPVCHDWVASLDAAIREAEDNVILVGHSLGSVTIAHWACHYGRKIVGALIVAPSDTDATTFPEGTSGFAPIPTCRFPFPSTVIASTEDPYMAVERVTRFSEAWGSNFISIGPHGHISTADGFGPWPEGLQYITDMRAAALATRQRRNSRNVRL
jgi:predicted alpha/beta hydrolase family esterase